MKGEVRRFSRGGAESAEFWWGKVFFGLGLGAKISISSCFTVLAKLLRHRKTDCSFKNGHDVHSLLNSKKLRALRAFA